MEKEFNTIDWTKPLETEGGRRVTLVSDCFEHIQGEIVKLCAVRSPYGYDLLSYRDNGQLCHSSLFHIKYHIKPNAYKSEPQISYQAVLFVGENGVVQFTKEFPEGERQVYLNCLKYRVSEGCQLLLSMKLYKELTDGRLKLTHVEPLEINS